ncbi:MAG TPA: hypothetical protein DCR69_08160 [Clostridium sp.]|nr:hypothetical protein [Clostridium sp.]
MEKNKSKLIYPFTVDTYPLAKLFSKKDMDVTFASPEGLSLVGKDLSYCVNREKINKNVVNLDKALQQNKYDEILIPTFNNYELLKSDLNKIIQYATHRNIKVNSLDELDEFKDDIKKINQEGTHKLEHIMNSLNTVNAKYYEDVKAIVIFVVGLFETIDSTLISMITADFFNDSSYNVKIISNKKECILNNGYNYPLDFLNSKDISKRIISLNRFIQALEISESPDIIFVDIPGGLLRKDEFWHNDFGLYLHLIGLSVKPDYIISTIPFNIANSEFLDGLNEHIIGEFNKKIDVFSITNTLINTEQHVVENIDRPVYTDLQPFMENIKELKEKRSDVMYLDNLCEFMELKTKIIKDLS